jgi:hypothetical protein
MMAVVPPKGYRVVPLDYPLPAMDWSEGFPRPWTKERKAEAEEGRYKFVPIVRHVSKGGLILDTPDPETVRLQELQRELEQRLLGTTGDEPTSEGEEP